MRKRKVVPMKGGKSPSQSRVRRELDPTQKPGAGHYEKRARRILARKKGNKSA